MKKKVTVLMHLLSLTIILAFLASAETNAQTGKVNFEGSWALNTAKSTQPQGGGGRMGGGGGDFTAAQGSNLLTVTRTRTGQDGTSNTTIMKYSLDGKESVNTSQRGDSKSAAKWSADGKTLTISTSITMERNGVSSTINSTEVWTLTDAKTLTVVSTRNGQDGTPVSATMVYDKK